MDVGLLADLRLGLDVDPIMQSYHDDGWHVKDRLRSALRANIKFYVITVAIIVVNIAIFNGGLQGSNSMTLSLALPMRGFSSSCSC